MNHDENYMAQAGNAGRMNQKGVALVIVLILSAIGLMLMTTLIYVVTTGTQTSGLQKRYKTALEAGMGGKDIVLQYIALKDSPDVDISNFTAQLNAISGISAAVLTPDTCTNSSDANQGLLAKLRTSTYMPNSLNLNWLGDCNRQLEIDPTDPSTYDMRFNIGAGPVYTVYAKIANTVIGADAEEGSNVLVDTKVVGDQGSIQAPGDPNLYTIELHTENSTNPQERSKLQVIYMY